MVYEYTDDDRVENPHYYMYTKYHGVNFLEAYLKNRIDFIQDDVPLGKDKLLVELPPILKKITGVHTTTALLEITNKTLSGEEDPSIYKALSAYLGRYEVTKKLYSSYDEKMKPETEDFQGIGPYVMLAVACGAYYLKNGNLKFLNCLLKLSDVIISSQTRFDDDTMHLISKYAVATELVAVRELSQRSEVLGWY